jgi:hypothetical protein
VTNLKKILKQLSTTKHPSTSNLPSDAFNTNLLLYNYMMGFLNSDTDVFGWPTIAITHIFGVSNKNQLVIGKNIDSVEQ